MKIVHPKPYPKIDADLSELSILRQWELGQGNWRAHGYSESDISQPVSGLTLQTNVFTQGFTLGPSLILIWQF